MKDDARCKTEYKEKTSICLAFYQVNYLYFTNWYEYGFYTHKTLSYVYVLNSIAIPQYKTTDRSFNIEEQVHEYVQNRRFGNWNNTYKFASEISMF